MIWSEREYDWIRARNESPIMKEAIRALNADINKVIALQERLFRADLLDTIERIAPEIIKKAIELRFDNKTNGM